MLPVRNGLVVFLYSYSKGSSNKDKKSELLNTPNYSLKHTLANSLCKYLKHPLIKVWHFGNKHKWGSSMWFLGPLRKSDQYELERDFLNLMEKPVNKDRQVR